MQQIKLSLFPVGGNSGKKAGSQDDSSRELFLS